jgi:hypothetical protein
LKKLQTDESEKENKEKNPNGRRVHGIREKVLKETSFQFWQLSSLDILESMFRPRREFRTLSRQISPFSGQIAQYQAALAISAILAR